MSEEKQSSEETLTPDQIKTRKIVAGGGRGGVGGPRDVWVHSEGLARVSGPLGAFFRSEDNALCQRLTELAIIVTARAWTAQIEWYAHVPRARRAGIGSEIVAAIAERRPPEFDQLDEEIVYKFATEVNESRKVTQTTFDRAVEHLGTKAVVDLTALIGFYSMVAVTLKTYELLPPSDAKRLLPE